VPLGFFPRYRYRTAVRGRWPEMIHFLLVRIGWAGGPLVADMTLSAQVVNRQGKVRLVKFYSTYAAKERTKLQKEAIHAALQRREKLANFIDFHEHTLVYKRYASLFFVLAIDKTDNELIALELIHSLVMLLDRFFQVRPSWLLCQLLCLLECLRAGHSVQLRQGMLAIAPPSY
jgi:hypothetical protein